MVSNLSKKFFDRRNKYSYWILNWDWCFGITIVFRSYLVKSYNYNLKKLLNIFYSSLIFYEILNIWMCHKKKKKLYTILWNRVAEWFSIFVKIINSSKKDFFSSRCIYEYNYVSSARFMYFCVFVLHIIIYYHYLLHVSCE